MLIFFLFFSFCSVGHDVNAQSDSSKVRLTWSDPIRNTSPQIIDAISVVDGYLVLRKEAIRGPGGWRISIDRYDQNFRLISSEDISNEVKKGGYKLIGMMCFEQKAFLHYEKRFNYTHAAQEINLDNLDLASLNDLIVLDRAGTYETISQNKEFSLAFHSKYSGNRTLLDCFVFDQDYNSVISEKDLDLQRLSIKESLISNSGVAIFLLTKNRKTGHLFGNRDPKKMHFLFIDEGNIDTLSVPLKYFVNDDPSMFLSEEGTLKVYGYYRKSMLGNSRKRKLYHILTLGVYSLEIDLQNKTILKESYHPFSSDILFKLQNESAISYPKNKKGSGKIDFAFQLRLEKVLELENGSYAVIGYQYWSDIVNGGDRSYIMENTGYTLCTIIDDDQVKGHVKLDKHIVGAEGQGYVTFASGNEVYQLTIDHVDNFRDSTKQKPVKVGLSNPARKSILSVHTISGLKSEKEVLIDYSLDDYNKMEVLIPNREFHFLENGDLIGQAHTGMNEYRFIRISVNK